jgi:hypothetical protein
MSQPALYEHAAVVTGASSELVLMKLSVSCSNLGAFVSSKSRGRRSDNDSNSGGPKWHSGPRETRGAGVVLDKQPYGAPPLFLDGTVFKVSLFQSLSISLRAN